MKLSWEKIKFSLSYNTYIYRFDIFSMLFMIIGILAFLLPIYSTGHVVFSDMAFGFSSERYMGEIFGVWNERFSTSTLLNTPRLIFILPFFILSKIFGNDGSILIKSFITGLIIISAISMYLLIKRLVSVYFTRHFDFYRTFAIITGSVFYAINPWVIERIQHIYLLCGYSLFPLIIMLFFNIFDPKFQRQIIVNYREDTRKIYKKNFFHIVLFAVTLSVASAAIHYFFFSAIYLSVVAFLLIIKSYFMFKKEKMNFGNFLINFTKKMALIVFTFCIFSGYWFFTYVGSIVLNAQASQHNVNVIDTLSIFSRNSSFENVAYLISYWWPMFDLTKLSIVFYIGGGVILLIILFAMIARAYKDHIILFFTICTVGFFFLATGVYSDILAPYFVIFVTKVPLIGSMFRDPNKLIGLMAVSYSVLLAFGIEQFFSKLGNELYEKSIKIITVIVVFLSMGAYISPFYINFIDGFYHPVNVPKEYVEVQNELKKVDEFGSKVLYIPIADNMTQSHTGVATPFWNKNANEEGMEKATGDIHVYSSKKNTVFHHEGNEPSITYYINYLQELIDKGLTRNFGKLISVFGINELAYHNEYLGQEERQQFNLKVLENQRDITLRDKNEIFSLFDLKTELPYAYRVDRKIYTPSGYSLMGSLTGIPNFDFRQNGVIFTSLKSDVGLEGIEKGDIISSSSYNDILLSNVDSRYHITPFEFINDGNAFLKWSKTLVKNNEWLWFLSSQGITNFPYDFDFGKGVAVTFASSKFNLPAYKIEKARGKIVIDFNSMLRTEKFFKADNPGIFEVTANPVSGANSDATLHGEVIRGDPKFIWQVAKSGLIEAKPNNPYKFSIYASGRGTNKMHVKVRFYNSDFKELGVSYVVAPAESVDFDSVRMFGEYVSPGESKYMRVDLLTYQREEQKNYWWIHDFIIEDMEEYKAPNTFNMNVKVSEDGDNRLFVRSLKSRSGGEFSVKIGNYNKIVTTLEQSTNKFEWVDLGAVNLKKGNYNVEVENISGFNAINLFVLIPNNRFKEYNFETKMALEKGKVMTVFEAENDFRYIGDIQSDRVYPDLSGGKAIFSKDGVLESDISIMKSSTYSLSLNINGLNYSTDDILNKLSQLEVELLLKKDAYGKKSEKSVEVEYCKTITSKGDGLIFKKYKYEDKIVGAVDTDYKQNGYPRIYKQLSDTMNDIQEITIKDIFLKQGEYVLRINLKSNLNSLSNFSDIHKFDPSEIVVDFQKPDPLEDPGYSLCERITPDMMNDRVEDGVLNIDFSKTCSIDWYNYASKIIDVKPDEEYLIKFRAVSERVRKRHSKVLFLDENRKIVDTVFINEVEEKDKNKWNDYSQIVLVPSKAKYMQIHILCKGSNEFSGFIKIKDYEVLPYNKLLAVDRVVLYEGSITLDEFINTNGESGKNKAKVWDLKRVDSMKREFKISNPLSERILVNISESPNKLWSIGVGRDRKRGDLVLNGVTIGLITEEEGNLVMEAVLRKIYYFGLIIFVLGVFVIKKMYNRFI